MLSKGVNYFTIGFIGAGGMGSGLCLLLAEKGHMVYFYDPDEGNVRKLIHDASNIGLQEKVASCDGFEALFKNINDAVNAAVYFMSVPHGAVAEGVVDSLRPYLRPDDIIIDCGNEHFENTERRQKSLAVYGVHYIGCGVSGGYQSARSGLSMSPGGNVAVVTNLLPFLQKIAAKDENGRPCTGVIGPGSSGHYVKMIHNGIEQGMMGILAEVWLIMARGLCMSYEDIADTFESWGKEGDLCGCFLIKIGADIMRTTINGGEHVVSTIRDKVVQDAEGSEGTGTWTCMEAVYHHVPAASILAAHLYRCASAFASLRQAVTSSTGANNSIQPPSKFQADSREQFLDDLKAVTYFGFISCFAEGLNVLRAKDKQAGWNLDYKQIMQVWRAGCIIRADEIINRFENVFKGEGGSVDDVFSSAGISAIMQEQMPKLKRVILIAIESDFILPTISQSFEHFKYIQSTCGPAQFIEAQLDCFGKHMFDTWNEPSGDPKTGEHHFEWRPAEGPSERGGGSSQ